jgi:hypothetical protein
MMGKKPNWLALSEKHSAKIREQQARSTAELIERTARERPGKGLYGPTGPIGKVAEPVGQASQMKPRPRPVQQVPKIKVEQKPYDGRGPVSPLGNKVW